MGKLYLQDSGYLTSANTGTQATNRANSGNAIVLQSFEFIPSLKRNISFDPELGTTDPAEINLGSLENMRFNLRAIFNTKSTTDMDTIKHLLDVIETPGYKFLWYNFSDANVEANNGQLVYQVAQNSRYGDTFTAGEQTAFSVSSAFSHLHVLIFDIQPKHEAKSAFITYQMQGIIIKVLPSQI